MKYLFYVKPISACAFFFMVANAGFAQATLKVDGAKMNVGTNVFLSTNDISVVNTNLLISGSTLKIANGITSAGAIDVSNGTVEMNGTAAQQIPASVFAGNLIKNLTINSSDNVTIGGALTLTDVLKLSNGSLAAAGYLTLRSDSVNTARVAPVTSNASVPVSGEVIAERFITSRRAFRFLTAPVNTSGSIKANWMENVNNPNTTSGNLNPNPHYGTHITGVGGNANGFDATSTNNPSLYTYNNLTAAWTAATNTSSLLHAGEPFRILVRGDRSTNLNVNAPPASITTVRAKGTLVTGTVVMAKPGGGGTAGMPQLSAANDAYSFIGNPYASPVDWALLDRTDVTGTIYIFDPTISGANGRGGYVSYNTGTGVSNIASSVDNNLQSGQAFFVQASGPNPSITFKEPYKTGENRQVFRNNTLPNLSVQLLLPGQETTDQAADGFAAYFSNTFDSSLGDEDSYKFTNQDENIAIVRNGKLLSIEGRKPVTANDTLPIRSWQLLQKNYMFKVTMSKFDATVTAYMEDKYLQKATRLFNDTVTIFPFSLNSDSASFAGDRFRVVFKPFTTLPVTLASVKAYELGSGVQVEWVTESEKDMEKYEIQHSVNALVFTTAGAVPAKINAGPSSGYSWFHAAPVIGDNYYRIKSVSKTGEVKYSQVVKVTITRNENEGSIAAVAESAGAISIKLTNIKKGKYAVSLVNTAGQKLYTGTISHAGGSAAESIKINNLLAAGIYNIQLSSGSKVYNAQVIFP